MKTEAVSEPETLLCEVCKREDAFGVAGVPGVPYSAAYGRECLKRNAHPYWLMRVNVIAGGGTKEMAAVLEWNTFVDGEYMTVRQALETHPFTKEEMDSVLTGWLERDIEEAIKEGIKDK